MAQANGSGSFFGLLRYVLLVALMVRVALPVYAGLVTGDTQAFFEVYTHEYREPALNLLSLGSYTASGKPEIYRPPGYPLLLLPGLLLRHEAIVTILLQIILSLLTVWLVFHLSMVIFENPSAALLAGLCYALEPLSIVFCSLLMPETLMTCLLVAFILYLCKYAKGGAVGDLTLSAVFLSLSVYVAAYLYFLPFMMVITLVAWGFLRSTADLHIGAWNHESGSLSPSPLPSREGDGKAKGECAAKAPPSTEEGRVREPANPSPLVGEGGVRGMRGHGVDPSLSPRAWLAHIALFLAICTGLLGAWQVRNYVVAGYGGFSGVFDRSLYYGQAASVVARQQGNPEFHSAWEDLDRRLATHAGLDANLSDELRYMRHEGLRILVGAPLEYVGIHVKGTVRTMLGLEAHTYLRLLSTAPGRPSTWDSMIPGKGLMRSLLEDRGAPSVAVFLVIALLAGLVGALYLFFAFAFISRTVPWTMPVITLLTVAAYILVVTGGPHGYSRYRHGIMPIVCIFAGYGLTMLWRRYGARSYKGNHVP
jgi:hypothetical protein